MNNDYINPILTQRADPWCYRHTDGYYYFTATAPEYDRIELRRADSINGIAESDVKVIWRKHETGEMGSHIWAPEIHYIDGKWYIYFTAGDAVNVWDIRPYALSCEAENPLDGEWIEEGRIDVGFESFSLDMTSFVYNGERYNIWAQTKDKEMGSCLFMARMDSPIKLATEPMLLTAPEYEWEKLGFKVNEGPAVLIRNGKIFVTYSASDTGWRYCMGLMWAYVGSDIMDISSWHKSDVPVFKTSEENGQYGPGHNCFTTDGENDVMIYHSRSYKDIDGDPLNDPNRHTRAKAIEYDENGFPVFGEPLPETKR